MLKPKKAIVIHSGGMDSSLCLALAIEKCGAEAVLSLSFNYSQRHSVELEAAATISRDWNVDHAVIDLHCLAEITSDALTRSDISIEHQQGDPPNTLVVGRNGLMARLGAIHGYQLGAKAIYLGVMELEEANSGYRDCSRLYMDKMEEILRIDLDQPEFQIITPLIRMTKLEALELAQRMGILSYLLDTTVTCYEGIKHKGCGQCPSCLLRNQALEQFHVRHPDVRLPYEVVRSPAFS